MNRGFTLIEILVVMSIVGILMALIAPAISKSLKSQGNVVARDIGGLDIGRETFEGHKYITFRYENYQKYGLGAVHDPDCDCRR